jgi:pimeloyl-ACP methyl ester carboxylesterase
MHFQTQQTRLAALADLIEAIRQLEGLTEQVGPFALPADTCDQAPQLVAAVCQALGVPLTFVAGTTGRDRDFAVTSLAAEIRRTQGAPGLAGLHADDMASLAAQARVQRDAEDSEYELRIVRRPDGTSIVAVDAGPPDAPCILFSPACAMSYRLSLPWIRALRGAYRCVVPQTRGTSGRIEDPSDFDRRGYGVPEQAEDLIALIEEFGIGPVHLMGLCGGVVPGLLAAARRPDYVSSVSMWHADLDLGPGTGKTEHQVNLRAMLDLAGESRETAAWVRDRLTSGPMRGVPPLVGPLVVRPYATTELFYRYAKLTGATMHWDSRQVVPGVTQPCLLVTSRDDHTADPAGSRRMAELLPDAMLAVADHGTHLDAFNATPWQVTCLSSFLQSRGGHVATAGPARGGRT